MMRLNRSVPTRSSAVQRPRACAGALARIAFGPVSHRFRTTRRVTSPRLRVRPATVGLLMRARATTVRRSTEIRTDDTRSRWTAAGGGVGGGGGEGGGGPGGGGPGGGGPGGGGPGGGGGLEDPTLIVAAIPSPPGEPCNEQ